jgi:acetyltransferase-like isoleucine patch superfamily enzyme
MDDVFIHPTALVETEEIGSGTKIWALAHVMKGARIGRDCNIGDHSFIESGAVLGDNVIVKNGNMIWEGVTLEDGVFVGPHVFFTNDLYPRSSRHPRVNQRAQNKAWLVHTLVREGASLGAGAVIVGGRTIGAFAMVGAGAVVTKDVVPHTLVIGNPARFHSWVCLCGWPLVFNAWDTTTCKCGLAYAKQETTIICTNEHTCM